MSEIKGSINSRIVELHREGKSVGEIAKTIGKSYQRVYNTLIVKGLEPIKSDRKVGEKKEKIMACLDEGKSIMKICQEVETYPPYVLKVKKEWKAIKAGYKIGKLPLKPKEEWNEPVPEGEDVHVTVTDVGTNKVDEVTIKSDGKLYLEQMVRWCDCKEADPGDYIADLKINAVGVICKKCGGVTQIG